MNIATGRLPSPEGIAAVDYATEQAKTTGGGVDGCQYR